MSPSGRGNRDEGTHRRGAQDPVETLESPRTFLLPGLSHHRGNDVCWGTRVLSLALCCLHKGFIHRLYGI